MPETTAGNHGDDDTRGSSKRRRNQAGLVAHSSGGMFIHLHSRDRAEVDDLARAHHGFGERTDFAVGHAGVKHGHQKSRHLIIRDFIPGIAVH